MRVHPIDLSLRHFIPLLLLHAPLLPAMAQNCGSNNDFDVPEALDVSSEPFFAGKVNNFPGCVFAMGTDTVARVLDPKYYSDSPAEMSAALARMSAHGTKICVGGRVSDKQKFNTLDDVLINVGTIPLSLASVFIGISEADFRVDISSTEIRSRSKGGSKEV